METTFRERIFFQNADVKVTSSRLLIYGMAYGMESINSVSEYVSRPKRIWPLIGILLGAALMLPAETRVGGAVLLMSSLVWLLSAKKKFFVKIIHRTGQDLPYSSTDEAIIQGIINAINRARE
jgi:hypothetical protein